MHSPSPSFTHTHAHKQTPQLQKLHCLHLFKTAQKISISFQMPLFSQSTLPQMSLVFFFFFSTSHWLIHVAAFRNNKDLNGENPPSPRITSLASPNTHIKITADDKKNINGFFFFLPLSLSLSLFFFFYLVAGGAVLRLWMTVDMESRERWREGEREKGERKREKGWMRVTVKGEG